MRVTVVKSDGIVCVDGVCYGGIDTSGLPSTLHALQWYETFGEEEHIDPETRRPSSIHIDTLAAYQGVIAQWQVKHDTPPQPNTPPAEG
jgi:hypothetical protein